MEAKQRGEERESNGKTTREQGAVKGLARDLHVEDFTA